MSTMPDREFLDRIDRHMEQGNEHMARGNELMEGVREEMRLSRELHADLRVFIRETNLRADRFLEGILNELRDLRAESQAQRQALLKTIDRRLGPAEPSPG